MKHLSSILLLLVSLTGFSQNWRIVDAKQVDSNTIIFQEPTPDKFTIYTYDAADILQEISNAAYRFSGNTSAPLQLPVNLKGDTELFHIYKAQFMEDGLQQKFSQLHAFVGKSVETGKSVYMSITPYESNFTILNPGAATFFLKSYTSNSLIAFNLGSQHYESNEFECEIEEGSNQVPDFSLRANDGVLRKYRYAVSVTGEYSDYTLLRLGISSSASDADKKTAIVGAILASVTRMNSVYERDVAVSLMLVSNNDQIVFLDANADNYDNSTTDMSTLLTASQAAIDSNIGDANYDVGQVWCQGRLQGLARRPAVCTPGVKARGAARGANVETDRFIISVASHELGHMFGANHTFSNSSCGGSRHDATAIESGSGTTIMSYAGICSPDVQDYTDDRFNIASMLEITDNYLNGSTGSCAQIQNLTNTAPTINTIPNKYIPISTPFVLETSGADADGDTLSYTWEEIDTPSSSVTTPPSSTWTRGPMFRPYPVTDTPKRYFPIIDTLLQNHLSHRWEVLPSVSRYLKFKATVKDNNPDGGQTATSRVTIRVSDTSGPFVTTSDTSNIIWTPGETKTITWDVANTNTSPVNCATVDILLSTDGGYTYDTVLATDVTNDGSEDITVPNVSAVIARYMVKAHDNYFFSINQGRITIGDFQNNCNTITNSTPLVVTDDDDTTGVESIIHVTDNYQITKVTVAVNISHTYISDLRLKLVSPAGTEIELFSNNCSSEDNLIATFDDDGLPMACNNLANNATIVPVQLLSAFIDEDTQGDWKLKAWDNHSGDEGTINSWSLTLCYMQSTGSSNDMQIENLTVSPNPFDDNLSISFPSKSDTQVISLYDLDGRLIVNEIYHKNDMFSQTLDLTNLTKGVYLLILIDGNTQSIRKVIKK